MRSCSVAVRLVSVHLVVPHPPKNATIARAVIELARQTIPSCHRSEVFSVSRRNMGELCNLWYNIAATARRMKHSASDRDAEGVYPGGRWRERRVLGRVGSPVEGPACQVRCAIMDNPSHFGGHDKHAPPIFSLGGMRLSRPLGGTRLSGPTDDV